MAFLTSAGVRALLRTAPLIALILVAATPLAGAAPPSISELQQGVRKNPRSAEGWDRLGQALARARRFEEAQEAFATALKYAPDSKHIQYHIALAHAWSGNYTEAERRYTALLARAPADHAIRLDYGQALAWDKKFPEARRQYETILAANPDHVEALRHLGLLAAWQGQYDEALTLLNRAETLSPRSVRVLITKGEIQSWKGDLGQAVATIRKALELTPRDASLWVQLGQVSLWRGHTRDARDAYQQAITLNDKEIDAHLGLARAHTENRNYKLAEQVLRHALSLFPSDPRLGKELAALAASQTLNVADLLERAEPILFAVILLVIFRHMRRYRRLLASRPAYLRLMLALLPTLAAATVLTTVFVLLGGAYYKEVEVASYILELLTITAMLAVILALVWLLRFERPGRRRAVLAIGAHPDDIEFGCGATLVRYREEGYETHGLILTGGEKGHSGKTPANARIGEAHAGANVLTLNGLRVCHFPDTQLAAHKDEIKHAIEDAIAQLNPDVIFTHTPHDVHSDHRTAFEATREAARGACTMLCYENPNTPPDFEPDYFVEVTHYLDEKLAAVARHRSQAGKAYADPNVIRSTAGFRGTQAKVKYAEAFESVRVLEKADVV